MKHIRDIRIVTHCVADLDAEISVWREYLGYVLQTRGELSAELCAAWGTSAETGKRFALMTPASGNAVYMRFVETGERPGYWPPVTWGWNATEILVQDPDELAAQLNGSPIDVFGGPGDLYDLPNAPRVMQTLGPSGAMLYFARILPGGSRYGLHGAKSPVDRVFNVVLGGPSLDELRAFYSEKLGLRIGEPMGFTMTLAAQACGVSPDTEFPVCVAPVRARNSILELDEHPDSSGPRLRETGCLPGGMSMVAFDTNDIDAIDLPVRREATAIAEAPYDGKRVAVIEGPAGEWLELIESKT
jgi:catechol 2,3-dioxygenase-like lactoylglutathione lyase family enzyme